MYKIYKSLNTQESDSYYSADVILETDDGFEFVCDCGDWDNKDARNMAKKIAKLLNEDSKS